MVNSSGESSACPLYPNVSPFSSPREQTPPPPFSTETGNIVNPQPPQPQRQHSFSAGDVEKQGNQPIIKKENKEPKSRLCRKISILGSLILLGVIVGAAVCYGVMKSREKQAETSCQPAIKSSQPEPCGQVEVPHIRSRSETATEDKWAREIIPTRSSKSSW